MTIRMEIACNRCDFIGYEPSGFHYRHFSRISEDGNDKTEYFHLCNKCQEELSGMVIYPKLDLKTIAHSQYIGVALTNHGHAPNMYCICSVHDGVIIEP